jgi:5-methylcytosine-specific restriction endonuclease McrA
MAPQLIARDGERCRRCGRMDDLTIDHIIPISAGGSDDLRNLQILCRPCNSRKGGAA